MITKVLNKLRFEAIKGENIFDTYNREQIIFVACQFGNEECRKMVHNYFQKFMSNPDEYVKIVLSFAINIIMFS